MAVIRPERLFAKLDGDFAVFLIGMRANRPWKIHKWLPIGLAMTRMVRELRAHPELGLLHVQDFFGFKQAMSVQYWRSVDQLFAYATDRNAEHLPAWKAFNKAVGSNGDVGIWHETYVVRAGAYESLYNNMPPFGLGAAGTLTAATGNLQGALARLRGDGGAANAA